MHKEEYTVKRLLQEGRKLLAQAGIADAAVDAWILLEHVTGITRAYFYAHDEEKAGEEQSERYLDLIRKRAGHIPVQHLTNEAWFMGYPFYVNDQVLIPRQDTETLVEEALGLLKKVSAPRILDMCTGSGCILLSLLMERPDASGCGCDLSKGALAVAERNAESLKVSDRCVFYHQDLFGDGAAGDGFDLLISNPPYIRTDVIEGLMEEVRCHDPFMALDGRGDGLYFYREICKGAQAVLKPEGILAFEIGYDQGAEVSALLEENHFREIRVIRDLAGLDRVVIGRKE